MERQRDRHTALFVYFAGVYEIIKANFYCYDRFFQVKRAAILIEEHHAMLNIYGVYCMYTPLLLPKVVIVTQVHQISGGGGGGGTSVEILGAFYHVRYSIKLQRKGESQTIFKNFPSFLNHINRYLSSRFLGKNNHKIITPIDH